MSHHPYRKQATTQLVVGSAVCATGALVAATAVVFSPVAIPVGVTLTLLGASFLYFGAFARAQTEAVQINNRAFDLVTRGQVPEAEALLDSVAVRHGYVRRAVESQRAMIAVRRGDAQTAEQKMSEIIELPRHFLSDRAERVMDVGALGIRAFARAMMGKEGPALEDVAAVRSSPDRTCEALARAAVAEAVVLARRDDRDALARSLRESAPLLEYMVPRERSLVRALRRMVEARATSVYREAARPDEAEGEPLLGEWVGKIVPGAAAFVQSAELQAQTRVAAPVDASGAAAGSTSVSRASARSGKRRRVALIAALLVLIFVVLLAMQLLMTQPVEVTTDEAPGLEPGVLPVSIACALFLSFFVGRIALALRKYYRSGDVLKEASVAAATGDRATAHRLLADVVLRAPDGIAAAAHLQLAVMAERRTDMATALKECDQGLARVSRTEATRAINNDILVPELVAQRALVLAQQGHFDLADAELAVLARDHAAFPYATRAILRVKLVQAVRRGDRTEAVRLARERTPELPLSRRDETLADVVLALSGGRTIEGEIERLHRELTEDPELAAWIEHTAPGSLERLRAAMRPGPRVVSEEAAEAEANGRSDELAVS